MLLRELSPEILPPRAALLAAEVILICVPVGSNLDLGRCGAAAPYGTVDVTLGGTAHRIAALRRRETRTDLLWPELPFYAESGLEPQILGEDVLELARELDGGSQRRLLAFLLGFCRKAFFLADDHQFAKTCLRLAQLCVPQEGVAQPVATATPAWMVLAGVQAPSDATIFILNPTRVRQSLTPRLGGHPSHNWLNASPTETCSSPSRNGCSFGPCAMSALVCRTSSAPSHRATRCGLPASAR